MIKFKLFFICCLILLFGTAQSQRPVKPNANEIYDAVQKLNVLGTVLYIAAHPDDENTRMISYFANKRKVRTAYLSLTRGDGGQNLIGTEIWEKLGLIRTNELLMARSVDGGNQFFSRANDFGYSKHPDETLAFWNKEEVMHDIIKVMREFRPDIVVNRFDHRRAGRTHGHHTSSAILSVEACDIAGDPASYAERLGHLEPWQPQRVFFNTGWWFYGGRDRFREADKSNLYTLDAGVYYPTKGLSNNEIAALSRSMHKSQGFGSTGTRGREIEYLELVKGNSPNVKDDPLSGIDCTWARVEGGRQVQVKIDALIQDYNFAEPSKNIQALVDIHKAIQDISDKHWREIKLREVEDIILASTGLFLEAVVNKETAVRGEDLNIQFEMINRSGRKATVDHISLVDNEDVLDIDKDLFENERVITEYTLSIPEDHPLSNPYWLNEKGTLGMYSVPDEQLIGKPVSDAIYTAQFHLNIEGLPVVVSRDLIYKTNSPVDGEVYKPFYIVPAASVSFSDPIYIFPDQDSKEIGVNLKAYRDSLKGRLEIAHPESWQIRPTSVAIDMERKGEEQNITFSISGPGGASSDEFTVHLILEDGTKLDQKVNHINYDHIPSQVLLASAKAKFERLNIKTQGKKIAYLQGAGDDIPQNLRQIGYEVDEVGVSDLTSENLKSYDALVMGIRAYNTKRELFLKKKVLDEYMQGGGTVVVQYNTSRRIKGDDIAPYPMELSRDRVTDELAEVRFEIPDHEVLNYPNKITAKDFEGWVQERGLYFPNNWSDEYSAPLSCNDKGEPSRLGGLLIAEVGKGHFIYTGYSWFRQLPAGVPGAFRLFANLLSIGKNAEIKNSASESGQDE